jgi:hypothetical protein
LKKKIQNGEICMMILSKIPPRVLISFVLGWNDGERCLLNCPPSPLLSHPFPKPKNRGMLSTFSDKQPTSETKILDSFWGKRKHPVDTESKNTPVNTYFIH